MEIGMDESSTRLIPYSLNEALWARDRPPEHRVPLPSAGDEVLYRHDAWGPVALATVERILDDPADPSVGDHNPDVWQAQRDPASGHYVVLHGKTVTVRKADPWPQLVLITRPPARVMLVTTQEARLRGSAGWLPLDWEIRHRPDPATMADPVRS